MQSFLQSLPQANWPYPHGQAQWGVQQIRTAPSNIDTAFVSGLHDSTTAQSLVMLFSRRGARVKVDPATQQPNISLGGTTADGGVCAYVTFETPQDAIMAFELNNTTFEDSIIQVQPVVMPNTARIPAGVVSQMGPMPTLLSALSSTPQQQVQLALQQARLLGMAPFDTPLPVLPPRRAAGTGARAYVPRVGDWVCPACRNCNYASRTACNKCKAPRPAVTEPPPGLDLTATHADAKPVPTLSAASVPEDSATDHQQQQQEQPEQQQQQQPIIESQPGHLPVQPPERPLKTLREGDWICRSCLNHNYAHREVCNRCKGPKPEDIAANNAELFEAFQQHQASSRKVCEGDWQCVLCRNHNYAHRIQCNRCGSPRQASDLTAAALLASGLDLNTLLQATGGRAALGNSLPVNMGLLNPASLALLSGMNGLTGPTAAAAPRNASQAAAVLAATQAAQLVQVAHAAALVGAVTAPRRPRATPVVRPGDWICPKCANHNFRQRTVCNRCQAPRPEGM
ncbi:hypothetical protein PAPYR_1918 [Paratrimastix pyriformis]|uniref:Uncharacterized protein n=1 Tax=Paratrimastix pyriformis TaxID=342808 RepID=A0ABQ8UVL1_9EUKA|nr:hypothetical protein PAPYR_1918 [Paratrimastix pyriformis]